MVNREKVCRPSPGLWSLLYNAVFNYKLLGFLKLTCHPRANQGFRHHLIPLPYFANEMEAQSFSVLGGLVVCRRAELR